MLLLSSKINFLSRLMCLILYWFAELDLRFAKIALSLILERN